MGTGTFNVKQYKQQAEKAKTSKNAGFLATSMCDEFNPANVTTRFSKRGPFNHFRDVITVLVGLDVTGSMDVIPKSLLTGKLGNLMIDLKNEFSKPNENLQLSFAGIGDAKSDDAPLQVTHFESDNRFSQQLPRIWLESHGGANGAESYNLLWWYAANKTHLNYTYQDDRKGILITIGDDNVHPNLTANEIQMWLDPSYTGGDISNEVLLNAVREQYHVYHIVVTDGYSYSYDFLTKSDKTQTQKMTEADQWEDLLGAGNIVQTVADGVAEAIATIVKQHRPIQDENNDSAYSSAEDWKIEKLNNLTDKQWEEVLSYTLCPLSREFMSHPVVWGSNKRACEKQAILDYIQEHNQDPFTQQPLSEKGLLLKPNLNIAQVCMDYKPFFDNLPRERREYLAELTIPVSNDRSDRCPVGSNATPRFFSASVVNTDSVNGQNTLEQQQANLECPITHELMTDPVILLASGHTFERAAIVEWFKDHDTDPLTGEVLEDKRIISNFALKRMCEDFLANSSGSQNMTTVVLR